MIIIIIIIIVVVIINVLFFCRKLWLITARNYDRSMIFRSTLCLDVFVLLGLFYSGADVSLQC